MWPISFGSLPDVPTQKKASGPLPSYLKFLMRSEFEFGAKTSPETSWSWPVSLPKNLACSGGLKVVRSSMPEKKMIFFRNFRFLIIFLMGQKESHYVSFLFFSNKIFVKKLLTSAWFELRSSELKASTLTTTPQQRKTNILGKYPKEDTNFRRFQS